MKPTANRIRQLLSYSKKSGELIWKGNRSRTAKRGQLSGTTDDRGRRRIGIDGKLYYSSNLIWLHVTGRWPKDQIDHVDGNPSNDAWHNLRSASKRQNCRNRKKHITNKIGIKGVSRCGSKYRATICVNYKCLHLGLFETAANAKRAYRAAAKQHFGEFIRRGV